MSLLCLASESSKNLFKVVDYAVSRRYFVFSKLITIGGLITAGTSGTVHIHVKESSKPGHVDVLMDLKRWLRGETFENQFYFVI